jgi:hypothetical protein
MTLYDIGIAIINTDTPSESFRSFTTAGTSIITVVVLMGAVFMYATDRPTAGRTLLLTTVALNLTLFGALVSTSIEGVVVSLFATVLVGYGAYVGRHTFASPEKARARPLRGLR